jgi:hypothetical protein
VVFSALSPSPAGLPMAFRPGHWCSFSSKTIPVGNVRVGASGLAPGLHQACLIGLDQRLGRIHLCVRSLGKQTRSQCSVPLLAFQPRHEISLLLDDLGDGGAVAS